MRITDLLKPGSIALGASPATKEEVLDLLVSLQEKGGNLSDPAGYKAAILAREAQGTTAIGEGIAVPHAKSDSVKMPGLAAVTVPDGVSYDAPDGQPVKLFS